MKDKNDKKSNNPGSNPYKAFAPYEEKDNDKFYGRRLETEDLYKLICQNTLSVIIGKSGIGKTSLLNAGVFPVLRKEKYLPIPIRLKYSKDNTPLSEQIRRAITDELTKNNIDVKFQDKDALAETLSEKETLWEYFYRVRHFDPEINCNVTPVLLFDQFEELFTLGKKHGDRKKLIDELYWLIEDQIPESIKDEKKTKLLGGRPDFRVIIGLREDYLPHMTELKPLIPSIDRVMYRVTYLNGSQAREIIGMPRGFKDKDTINNILRCFYPEEMRYDNKKITPDNELEIEPAFLSLLCHQLYEKKPIEPLPIEFRNKIFEDYYNSKVAEFPDDIKILIESKLLTEGGFRTPFYLEPKFKLRSFIDKLVNLRILRKSHDGEKEYIEISHDILALIIKEKREKRLAEKRRIENWRKKFRKFVYNAAAVLLVITGYAIYQTVRAINQEEVAQVNRFTAEALVEFSKDNTKAMLLAETAYRMGLPEPPPRASRVLSEIAYSSYERPFYSVILPHSAPVYSAVFSLDGKHVLTAGEAGTAILWNIDGNFKSDPIIFKHEGRVTSAVFFPDGKHILTTSWDKTAALWSLDGNRNEEFRHNGPVTSGVFSADGSFMLTASRDGTAKLWNRDSDRPLAVFNHGAAVSSASFSPDGELVITASWDKSARLWDMKGNLLQEFLHDGAVASVAFSPDGKQILTASWDNKARLWDMAGKVLKEFNHDEAVTFALFSREGSRILTASRDGFVRLWNLTNEAPLAEFKHDGKITSAEFSPDGELILTASKDGATNLWHLDGTLRASFKKHEGEVTSASFSPNGSKVLTASSDGTAKVWQLKNNFLVNLNHKDEVTSVTFSSDGSRILTTSRDKTAKLWDIEGNLLADLNKHKGVVYSAEFSPDGSRIVTASDDKTAKIWDSRGNFLYDLKHNGPVTSATFSHDGQILTASLDQTAKLWSQQGSMIKRFPTPNSALSSAIFSPDEKYILTVSVGGTVKVWNKEEGKQPVELAHDRSVFSAVFSPDGNKILTASTDGMARLWNTSGELIKDFKHQRRLTSAVFSPKGDLILTASYDGVAKIWSIGGEQIVELKHDSAVLSARFSRGGKRVITASEDGTAKLWSIEGELLANLGKHNGIVSSAVFSPDGNRILTASKDGTAKLWLTPDAIYEWLRKSRVLRLSEKYMERIEIQ